MRTVVNLRDGVLYLLFTSSSPSPFVSRIGHTKELAKNIDADEAMAMGAAFFAANLR